MKQWWLLCAVLFAASCAQESPTSVGAKLLPADAIRTFEVVLEPERFLVFDTAFGLFSLPSDVDFTIIAHTYGGALNSRALLRYAIPISITVRDTAGVARVDTLPRFFDGELRLIVDTAASTRTDAALQVLRTTESWDRTSATWRLRVDTAGVRIPWSQPGGSPGALVSTTSYVAGRDTVTLPVDSATIAAWADTTNAARGALIAAATANTRLRGTLPVLVVRARSTLRPDTVVEMTVAPSRTFIYEPEQPDSAAAPRVGGTPAWRTILRVRERLDTMTVPCPGSPNCRVRLSGLAIALAALQLQPVPAPPGMDPELPVVLLAHGVLPQARLPLQRSPITDPIGGTAAGIPTSSFRIAGGPVVELPITEFLRAAFRTPTQGELRPSHLALAQGGTTRTLGFATFAERPRLRLIVSMSRELELP